VPVSAIALGTLFLGEKLEFYEIAGALMIGLALVVIDGRVLKLVGFKG
jgi:drug/metabolite transporter (DMT)-like permease